jgi:hypothetical protein
VGEEVTKTAILVLSLWCGTLFLGGFSGALMTAMLATGAGELPNWAALAFAALTGLTAVTGKLLPVLQTMLSEFGVKVNGDASAVVKAAAKIS